MVFHKSVDYAQEEISTYKRPKMIRKHIEGPIATIELASPNTRNALGPEMLGAIAEAMRELNALSTIRVIVIAAEGKAFCAGANLKYLQQIRESDPMSNLSDSQFMRECFQLIYQSPKITIAKVHGDAIAGGCGLATVCDYIIAADKARFGFTEVAIGFVPAIVGVYAQRKIGENRARHMLLRAHLMSATEAREEGLVYKVVSAEDLDTTVNNLAEELSKHPASSIELTKKLLVHINEMDVNSALDYATTLNAFSRQTPAFRNGIDSMISRISGDKK